MANINITSPEAGKSDTITLSVSPKTLARVNSEKGKNQKQGVSEEESIWYRFQNALEGAGLATND